MQPEGDSFSVAFEGLFFVFDIAFFIAMMMFLKVWWIGLFIVLRTYISMTNNVFVSEILKTNIHSLFVLSIYSVYGSSGNQFVFLFGISFMHSMHSVSLRNISRTIKCYTFLFFLEVLYTLDTNYKISLLGSKKIDLEVLCWMNMFTRYYIFLYMFVKTISFKYKTTIGEEQLRKTAEAKIEKIEEEYSYLRRFTHFVRHGLQGILSMSYFIDENVSKMETLDGNDITEETRKKLKKNLDKVDSSCEDLTRQQNDLIGFFLIKNDMFEITIHNSFFNLKEQVDHIIEIQERIHIKDGKEDLVSVLRNFALTLPKYVNLDKQRFNQIFVNITNNAMKYTKEGEIIFRVFCVPELFEKDKDKIKPLTLTHPEEENPNINIRYLYVIVEDTGIGIEEKNLKNIFTPLAGQSDHHSDIPSFGLGLSNTREFVRRMNGFVGIESEGKDEGTTATIIFPCEVSETVPKEEEEEEEEEIEIFSNNNNDFPSFLLVEDIQIIRDIYKKQIEIIMCFEKDSEMVKTAINGVEALKCLREEYLRPYLNIGKKSSNNDFDFDFHDISPDKFPIVLTDVDMKEMNGLQLCHTLRNYWGKNVIIYCITGTVTGTDEEFIKKHGFDGVMKKPIKMKEMSKIIKFCMNERKKRIREYEERKRMNFMNLVKKKIVKKYLHINKKKKKVKKTKKSDVSKYFDFDEYISKGRIKVKKKSKEDENYGFKEVGGSKCEDLLEGLEEKEKNKNIKIDFNLIFVSIIANIMITILEYVLEPSDSPKVCYQVLFSWIFFAGIQYIIFYFLGYYSTKTSKRMNLAYTIFSISRSFIAAVTGSQFSNGFYRKSSKVYLAQLTYFHQIATMISSFPLFLVLSVLFFLQIIGNDFFRPFELYMGETNDWSINSVFEYIVVFYYVLNTITMSTDYEDEKELRSKKFKEYIEKSEQTEKEMILTCSKIAHDMVSPTLAMKLLMEDIAKILGFYDHKFKQIRVPRRRKRNNNNNIINNNNNNNNEVDTDDDDFKKYEELKRIYLILYQCVININNTFINYVTCLKLRNDKVNKSLQKSSIDILLRSIIPTLYPLKSNKTKKVDFKLPKKFIFQDNDVYNQKTFLFDFANVVKVLENLLLNSFLHSKAREIHLGCEDEIVRLRKPQTIIKKKGEKKVKKVAKYGIKVFLKEIKGRRIDLSVLEPIKNVQINDWKNIPLRERFSNTLGLGLVLAGYLSSFLGVDVDYCRAFKVDKKKKNSKIKIVEGNKFELIIPVYNDFFYGKGNEIISFEEEEENIIPKSNNNNSNIKMKKKMKIRKIEEDEGESEEEEEEEEEEEYKFKNMKKKKNMLFNNNNTRINNSNNENNKSVEDIRVLVLDDHKILGKIYVKHLSEMGVSVSNIDCVQTMDEANQKLDELYFMNNEGRKYDIIIIDHKLGSGNTGVGFVNSIHQRKLPEVNVLVTGGCIRSIRKFHNIDRFHDLLDKPTPPSVLFNSLRSVFTNLSNLVGDRRGY